jgi:hypothetical protein
VSGEAPEQESFEDEAEVGEGKGLKPSRALGGALNALVRATALYRKSTEKWEVAQAGSASDTMRMIAERVARAWRRATPGVLELEALRALVGTDEVLRANKDHTQWVLLAFMAGVRRIAPRRAMTASDVIRFVQALCALEPTLDSIEGFRNWIDADGAEGFDVRVHTSFREVFEEVDLEEEKEFRKAFAMARFEAPRSGDAVYIAAKDLDKVAMRKEFEMPIELYASGAMSAAGGMTDEELAALGPVCDDAKAWATAELEAVLAIPELHKTVTPERMARRIVTRLSAEADSTFLMLLTSLNSRKDPFRQAVAQALGTREVGEIIARQLQLSDDPGIEALGNFLVLSPAPLATAVVSGMLDRATDDIAAKYATGLLAEWYGSAQFLEWIQATGLTKEAAAVAGAAVGKHAPNPGDVTKLVGAATLDAGLGFLSALPPKALDVHGRALRLLWGRASGETAEQVADLMISGGSPDNLKLLGDLLLAGKLNGWTGRVKYALCRAEVAHQLGRPYVLTLALDQRADEGIRLIAIDCLQNDAELAKDALRFRVARFFDSQPVKDRLKKLAAQQKQRSTSA